MTSRYKLVECDVGPLSEGDIKILCSGCSDMCGKEAGLALRAALAGAGKDDMDALRYRWLRGCAKPISKTPDIFSGPITLLVVSPIYAPDTWGATVDSAIDSAISAAKEKP